MSEEELDKLVFQLREYAAEDEYVPKAADAITFLRAQIDHLTRVINTIGPSNER